MRRAAASIAPGQVDLHIFDFDGTIFNSPSPRVHEVLQSHGESVAARLWSPVTSGGYGWFQSPATLAPPAVPERPDVGEWYVTPVVARLKALARAAQRGGAATVPRGSSAPSERGSGGGHDDGTEAKEDLHCFVLTGRDEKYRARIEALLDHAGLLPLLRDVFLKPHETAGTVKYKLNTIFRLVQSYSPRRVFYYEDRPEQGGSLYEGIRVLQEAMYAPPGAEVPLLPLTSLIWLPTEAREGESAGPSCPLTFAGLFHGDEGAERRAVRAGRRWAADTVAELNRRERERASGGSCPGGEGPCEAPFRRPRIVSEGVERRGDNGYHPFTGEDIALEPVSFSPPPRFEFTMVMVPTEWAKQSERVLSPEAQRALVSRLVAEREAYDAGEDAYAAYRGPDARQGLSRGGGRGGYGSRGSGGYGGYTRGMGYARGSWQGGRGGSRGGTWRGRGDGAPASNHVPVSSVPFKDAYPTLPPA